MVLSAAYSVAFNYILAQADKEDRFQLLEDRLYTASQYPEQKHLGSLANTTYLNMFFCWILYN